MTGEQEALALCAIGEEAIKHKDWPKAEASFERAVSADVACVRGWLGLSHSKRERMAYDSAEKSCRSALNIDSMSTEAWIELSEIFGEQCKWPETTDACERALSLNPNCAKALANLAVVRSANDAMDEAISLLERSYALDAKGVDARCTMGWIRLREGNYDAAMASANIALELDSHDDGVHYLIGSIHHARGDNETAAQSFDAAAAYASRPAMRYYHLISACTLREDHWKAIEHYKAITALCPLKSSYQTELGTLYYKVDRMDDALPALRTAVKLNPSDADAHYMLACIYVRRGDRDALLREIKVLRRLNAAWADMLYRSIIPWELSRTRYHGLVFMGVWLGLGGMSKIPSGWLLIHPLYLCLGLAIFGYYGDRYIRLQRMAREPSPYSCNCPR
jgi:tetratricopeptide (TPR) repeat protein